MEDNVTGGRGTGTSLGAPFLGFFARSATLADLAQLPIQVDPQTDQQAWSATLRLAERHQLTLFDAAYLELALRRNLPLATLDDDLRRAAEKEKVRVLG